MATIDEQFIEYIAKQLVDNPEEVKIERKIDEKGVLLELTVSPEDIGRVIGKRGNTAQSMRNLLRALGSKNDARYNLKIVDVDRPETPKSDSENIESEGEAEVVEDSTSETVENTSDLAKKTREELADLDDIDI